MNKKIEIFEGKCRAAIRLPGSKSVTNRAMLLAALAGGHTRLEGALFSRDTAIMADCLAKLGCKVDLSDSECVAEIFSEGAGSFTKEADFHVGNAGTAARFVTAVAALVKGGNYLFDADEAMYARPVKGLCDALRAQGAQFEFLKAENSFPFRLHSNGLCGGDIKVDASASSQILSALLMASAFSDKPSKISLLGETVSRPFVAMTVSQMLQFGLEAAEISGGVFEIKKAAVDSSAKRIYVVEPDASAASYFAMLAALTGGAVLLCRFGECSLQGDAAFADLLESAGLVKNYRVDEDLLVVSNVSNLEAPQLAVSNFDFNDISDTFLTFAAGAPMFKSPVRIGGISHTRAQETDRVCAAAAQLSKLCQNVREGDSFIEITPFSRGQLSEKLSGKTVSISTYDDHRMAMAFAVAGCVPVEKSPWIQIENPGCVSKTFPEFFDVLDSARKASKKFRIVAIDGGAAVGKSSVSRECSSALGYMHVDTGAHYRTVAFGLLESGIDPDDVCAIVSRLSELKLGTALDGQTAKMTLNGVLVEDRQIRNKTVNENVAKFAAIEQVRQFLKNYQRSMAKFAEENGFDGLIMEGRDIGSVIFPSANIRIFLDADEQTRAARRAKEGISDSITKRDALDKSRKTAPLVCAEGAVKIDTSNMTKQEVVAKTLCLILKS